MHKLLERQVRRHLAGGGAELEALAPFLRAVSEAYQSADSDRELLEHAMDMASEELVLANQRLRQQVLEKERLVEETERARRQAEDQAVELELQSEELQEQAASLEEAQAELEAANEQLLQTNEELERAADRMRFIMNSMPQKVLTADAKGFLNFVNDRWVTYTGVPGEDLLGTGWQRVIHPDDQRAAIRMWEEAIATGEPFEAEQRLRRADGTYCWHLSRGTAERQGTGGIRMWIVTHTDIHEQKEQEDALRRSAIDLERLAEAARLERERVERIFSAAPAVMALYTGPDHVITMVNPTWERTVGKPDAVGKPFREVFPEFEGSGLFELLDDVYNSGTPYVDPELTVPLRRWENSEPDETVWSLVWMPLPPRAGESGPDILVHAVEVTAQVRAREEVELARAAAEEANRVKAGFLATMSHELRTPLNAMIGYTDLLELGIPDPLPDQALEKVRRIGLSARHLLQLIEEILTFSRLEAGRETVHPEQIAIVELVHEVVAIAEPLAHENGLELVVSRRGDCEAMTTDPRKLRQILINLVGNAVKFTEEGEIEVKVVGDSADVAFIVADTGIGIAPEHLEAIFEPFLQVEGESGRRAHGTGLGLSVSRRLARLLGGDLTVESRPGEGSIFTLRLPCGSQKRPHEEDAEVTL